MAATLWRIGLTARVLALSVCRHRRQNFARGGAAHLAFQERRLHATEATNTGGNITSSVPIIDMSLSDEVLGDSIHHACTTVGFFIIVGHGVSEDLLSRMLHQARLLFTELSPDDKEAISVRHSNSYRGFQTMGVNVTNGQLDGHEALDLVSESARANISRGNNSRYHNLTNYGKNQWPDPELLPDFRSTTEEYIDVMQTVGRRLMGACSRGLGLHPKFFEPYFDDAYWTMRIIRYPAEHDRVKEDYEFGVGKKKVVSVVEDP
jgi:isopenicillin N synthase-like dioxygenase